MTVIRNLRNSYNSGLVREHWTADTREELMVTFTDVERNYPTQGYGTTMSNVHQDPTGLLWHADFSRFNSCD